MSWKKKLIIAIVSVVFVAISISVLYESPKEKAEYKRREAVNKARLFKRSFAGKEMLKSMHSLFFEKEPNSPRDWETLYYKNDFDKVRDKGKKLNEMSLAFAQADQKFVDWYPEVGLRKSDALRIYREKTIVYCYRLFVCLTKDYPARKAAGLLFENYRTVISFADADTVATEIVSRLEDQDIRPEEARISVKQLRALVLADFQRQVSALTVPDKELGKRIRKYGFTSADFPGNNNFELYL